jgi:(2Fe-2S) ferredoxin
MATAAGAWDRLRDQLQSLERALAAASAPGACPAPSSGGAPSSSGRGAGLSSSTAAAAAAYAAAAAFSGAPLDAPAAGSSSSGGGTEPWGGAAGPSSSGRLTVLTRGGGAVELTVPDPDAAARGLQAPTMPRLAAAGRVQVCTGRKCCAQGARCTLAAAQLAAAGSDVEVTASKCMGKCGHGPCVRTRVTGREGSSLTKGVDAEAAPQLLRQQFGAVC